MLSLEQQKQLRAIVKTQRDYQRKLLDLATTPEQVRIIGSMTGDIVELLGDEWMCEEAAVTPKVKTVTSEGGPVTKAAQKITHITKRQRAKMAYEMFIEWRNGLTDLPSEIEANALVADILAMVDGNEELTAKVHQLDSLLSDVAYDLSLQAFVTGGELAPVSTWIKAVDGSAVTVTSDGTNEGIEQ